MVGAMAVGPEHGATLLRDRKFCPIEIMLRRPRRAPLLSKVLSLFSMTQVFQIAHKRLAATSIIKNDARHGQVPRANGLEVWGLVCCLREKRLEVIDGKQDGYSVAKFLFAFVKQTNGYTLTSSAFQAPQAAWTKQ